MYAWHSYWINNIFVRYLLTIWIIIVTRSLVKVSKCILLSTLLQNYFLNTILICIKPYFAFLSFRFLPFSTLVPLFTLWIIRSCWTGCPFRTEFREFRIFGNSVRNFGNSVFSRIPYGISGIPYFREFRTEFRLDAILHRRSHTDGSLWSMVRSRGVLSCDLVLHRDQFCPILCVQKFVGSLGFRVHLYADVTQFHNSCKSTDAAELIIYQPVPCASLRLWGTGCRRTGSDWTPTRHSTSGSEQATSCMFFRSIPFAQMKLSTTWQFISILNYSWNAKWINEICQVCYYFHLQQSAGR